MKYQGSKRSIIKKILPFLLENRKNGQYYVEPFVGGGNSIMHVTGKRIGGDINPYITELWKGVLTGKEGKHHYTYEEYDNARNLWHKGVVNFEVAWIGFVASFSGRFYPGGYARESKGRHEHDEIARSILKQAPFMQDIDLYHCSYDELSIPDNSIIYCDPPYQDTKSYGTAFDNVAFHEWCREQKRKGHTVFVSEYDMPDDFRCVWEGARTCRSIPRTVLHRTEKLFTL